MIEIQGVVNETWDKAVRWRLEFTREKLLNVKWEKQQKLGARLAVILETSGMVVFAVSMLASLFTWHLNTGVWLGLGLEVWGHLEELTIHMEEVTHCSKKYLNVK